MAKGKRRDKKVVSSISCEQGEGKMSYLNDLEKETLTFICGLMDNWIPSNKEVLRLFGFGYDTAANKKLFTCYRENYLAGKITDIDLDNAMGDTHLLNQLLGKVGFNYKVAVLTCWQTC